MKVEWRATALDSEGDLEMRKCSQEAVRLKNRQSQKYVGERTAMWTPIERDQAWELDQGQPFVGKEKLLQSYQYICQWNEESREGGKKLIVYIPWTWMESVEILKAAQIWEKLKLFWRNSKASQKYLKLDNHLQRTRGVARIPPNRQQDRVRLGKISVARAGAKREAHDTCTF